eukprot:scaffold7821_cov116-Cylindrotheca_fusiformis.AAC.2
MAESPLSRLEIVAVRTQRAGDNIVEVYPLQQAIMYLCEQSSSSSCCCGQNRSTMAEYLLFHSIQLTRNQAGLTKSLTPELEEVAVSRQG